MSNFSVVFNAHTLSGYTYAEAIDEMVKLFQTFRTVGATASILNENGVFEIWYLDKDFVPRSRAVRACRDNFLPKV